MILELVKVTMESPVSSWKDSPFYSWRAGKYFKVVLTKEIYDGYLLSVETDRPLWGTDYPAKLGLFFYKKRNLTHCMVVIGEYNKYRPDPNEANFTISELDLDNSYSGDAWWQLIREKTDNMFSLLSN